MAASRTAQQLIRKGLSRPRTVPSLNTKLPNLNRKFVHPFTFEEAGPSNTSPRISTQSRPTNTVDSKSYATVASHHSNLTATADKFRVPFDEGAKLSTTLDNIVEHVESIPEDVEKEKGYQIIGKVKAKQDDMLKILAVGDLRIWQ